MRVRVQTYLESSVGARMCHLPVFAPPPPPPQAHVTRPAAAVPVACCLCCGRKRATQTRVRTDSNVRARASSTEFNKTLHEPKAHRHDNRTFPRSSRCHSPDRRAQPPEVVGLLLSQFSLRARDSLLAGTGECALSSGSTSSSCAARPPSQRLNLNRSCFG